MGQKIERDHQRFRKIVRGKVKSNLAKYIGRGELIGKKGRDLVSIPLPQIEIPQFRYGAKGSGGVGQGDGDIGQPLGPPQPGDGSSAGDQPGGHVLEVELTMEEMAAILGEELALPRIEPRGKKNIVTTKDRYSGIRQAGPESLRHFKRTFKRAMKRQIASGIYDPERPIVVPIREDKQYRSWKEVHQPQSVAVIVYMMDVSGSMTDEQKEIVRIEAFWIDTWIKAHYQGVETAYIIHDAAAQEVDEHTFYHTRESGGTKISSAYGLADKIISARYPPDQWNVYAFHFSDGDNWGDDNAHCIELLTERLLPRVNLFGYGQVESPYGSGEFFEFIHELLGEHENVVASRIPDREAILGSIKEFLGTGVEKSETMKPYNTNLPPDLRALREEIEAHARSYGLDFYETIFEVVDADDLNEIASYGGFPTRYPHWSFGMAYEELKKSYDYGLSKIYEMVINNDPCYAYLMRCNHVVDQKLVMAHVYGHCDFFKNNAYFAHTSRKMMDEMANHGTRIRRYAEKQGEDEVETFVDRCMSIDDLIDVHSVAIRRREEISRYDFSPEPEADDIKATRFKSKDYMDDYINPRDVLKAEEDERKKLKEQTARNFPERPEKDILLFLIENAPLKGWQRDVLSIVRDEAYYFAPQAMTKILNEGWASFWHSTIMTERALEPWECIDYADHHSGTMATYGGRINPYKLGIELLRHVEHRWNTGKFGKDYEECDDLEKKRTWDRKLGLGKKKIFEVRRIHNDITFIDTFLTPEFCREHKMFSYAFQEQAGQYVIESREFEKIKKRLLYSLTNFGKPWIYVVDGNYRNRGELLLRHEHHGVDLKLNQAADTLANIQFMWSRPVHLQTIVDGKPTTLSFDGTDHAIRTGGESDDAKRNTPAKTR